MPKAIDQLKDRVPAGIYQSVEALIKTVKRDAFAVAETKNKHGEVVYLFCSYEPQPRGQLPIVRTICEILPLDAEMDERTLDLNSNSYQ